MLKRKRDVADDQKSESSKTEKSLSAKLTSNDYTVGWICALPKEQTAATAMLDEIHPDLSNPVGDTNTYTLGSIGSHNIVIACLPKGRYGTTSAAVAATQMINTFPSIRVGLMVGIGGGIPPRVRLGDVVISTPVDQYPGVIQWNMGKAGGQNGCFKRTGALNNPPSTLLTALSKLETKHDMIGPSIQQYLDEMAERWPKLVPKFTNPNSLEDPFSDSGVSERETRIHYGLIASGNQVVKDASIRDDLNGDLGGNVLCIEMEAAGLMNSFPCVVIRGIADYCDSHKEKDWQEFAAAVAAAYAKELLQCVQPTEVEAERPVKDILADVLDSTLLTRANIDTISSNLEKKEDLEVLNWLTPVEYGPQHSDYLERRHPGTGQWLLDSSEYQIWVDSAKQTLFCPGIPGAGKTILSATVIDAITTRFQHDQSVGTAYIYLNFRQQSEQKLNSLMASLLKQLSQGRSSLPEGVRKLTDIHMPKRTRPTLSDMTKALYAVTFAYSRVFVFVDALDECHADDCGRFLKALFDLQAACDINLFATSRFIPHISERFKGSLILEIRATDQDVRAYLEEQISGTGSKLLISHREEIQSEIPKSVDGMFLLEQLHFNTVRTKRTAKMIKEALKGLPTGSEAYSDAYNDAMSRIEAQDADARKLAKDILAWICQAKRLLSTMELRHALAVEAGSQFDPDNLLDPDDMISVCAGLVTVDDHSKIIRLIHYTAEGYFQETWTKWFLNAHHDITTTCLRYLLFDCFNVGACHDDSTFEERLDAYPLYSYAASNWGYHALEQQVCGDLIMALLLNNTKLEASVQSIFASKDFPGHSGYSQQFPRSVSGLHLAAYFGLDLTAQHLIRSGHFLDSKDSFSRTPLLWAALNGCRKVFQSLLNMADANSRDDEKRTPLSWAACNGHEAIVKSLLALTGIDIDPRDENGRTPLSLAASGGYRNIALLLLQAGADPNSQDDEQRTPMTWAAYKGHTIVTQILLASGANPDCRDIDGMTPITWAAASGSEGVIQLLLAHHVDSNCRDKSDRTPLSWAACNGNESVVRLLLSKGAKLDSKDRLGRSPMSWAEYYGFKEIAKILRYADRGATYNALESSSAIPGTYDYLGSLYLDCERCVHIDLGNVEPRSQLQRTQQLRGAIMTTSDTTSAIKSPHVHSQYQVQDTRFQRSNSHHGRWKCPLCSGRRATVYSSMAPLKRHIQTMHFPEHGHHCPFEPSCKDRFGRRLFLRKDKLLLHCRSRHNIELTRQEMEKCRVDIDLPPACAVCHLPTASRAQLLVCTISHGRQPSVLGSDKSSTDSDGDDNHEQALLEPYNATIPPLYSPLDVGAGAGAEQPLYG